MSATVTCSTCGRPWPWNAGTAGHTLRCKCGSLVKVPVAVPAVPVEEEEPAPTPMPVAVAAGAEDDGATVPLAPVAEAPPVKPSKALPYRRLRPGISQFDRQRALALGSPVREIWVPLGLIAVGSLL